MRTMEKTLLAQTFSLCFFYQFSSVILHWMRTVFFCIVISSSISILFVSDKVCTSDRRGSDEYVCRTGTFTVQLYQDG